MPWVCPCVCAIWIQLYFGAAPQHSDETVWLVCESPLARTYSDVCEGCERVHPSFKSPLDIHALFKVSLLPFPGGLLREFFNVRGNGNTLWLLEIRLLICYCKLKLFVFKPQLLFQLTHISDRNILLELTQMLKHTVQPLSPLFFCCLIRHESGSGRGHCSLKSCSKLTACIQPLLF